MDKPASVSVFDYLDFREYLAAYYVANKEARRGFSYRAFSQRAGLRSPNHLKLVTEGARRLTPDMIPRFARALRLNESESQYFATLVDLNQAKTSAEKADAYRRLTRQKAYRKIHRVDRSHAMYYSRWYVPAIREMAQQKGFVADPEWISERMIPRISEQKAKEALQVLYALDLLRKEQDGSTVATDSVLVAEDATRGVHLATYHATMLNRAKEALSLLPATERNVSAVTLCVDGDTYKKIVERVRDFRRDIVALASAAGKGQRVLHVGLQVFPLTRQDKAADSTDRKEPT